MEYDDSVTVNVIVIVIVSVVLLAFAEKTLRCDGGSGDLQ